MLVQRSGGRGSPRQQGEGEDQVPAPPTSPRGRSLSGSSGCPSAASGRRPVGGSGLGNFRRPRVGRVVVSSRGLVSGLSVAVLVLLLVLVVVVLVVVLVELVVVVVMLLGVAVVVRR